MTGRPAWGFPVFDAAAGDLRAAGFAVVSPAELDRALGFDEHASAAPAWFDYERALRIDLEALSSCDLCCVLPEWEKSPGACREVDAAREWRLGVATLDLLLAFVPARLGRSRDRAPSS